MGQREIFIISLKRCYLLNLIYDSPILIYTGSNLSL
nr:MAG TPA: hypothetical protein [Caudoviricetes sp.]